MFHRLLVLCVVGVLASVALAQEPPEEKVEEGAPIDEYRFPPQQAYELRGYEIPYYYCVRSFFTYGYQALGRGDAAWKRLLDGVGIQPGSDSEKELRTAILLAANVWSRAPQIDANPAEDPVRFDEEQMQWRLDQRRELAPIFRQLRGVVVEEYGTTTNLDTFIEKRIRPGLSLGSSEPFGEEELTMNAEFERMKGDDQ